MFFRKLYLMIVYCSCALLAIASTACVTYTGVAKDKNGQVYLTGATNFFVFSSVWVKRCEEDGKTLDCQILLVQEGRTPYRESSTFVPQKRARQAPDQKAYAEPAVPLVQPTTPSDADAVSAVADPSTPPQVDTLSCTELMEKICTCQSKFSVVMRRVICDRARNTFAKYRSDAATCLRIMRGINDLAECTP